MSETEKKGFNFGRDLTSKPPVQPPIKIFCLFLLNNIDLLVLLITTSDGLVFVTFDIHKMSSAILSSLLIVRSLSLERYINEENLEIQN